MREIRSVAVFGSSEPVEGDRLYRAARKTGAALASAGYRVVTGGYGGVMEGASRGAREAGGRAFGVLCEIFPGRRGNRYLTGSIMTRDLLERTHELIRRSDAWVVLNGKAGTLSELTMVWALQRAGCLNPAPVILFGDGWAPVLDTLLTQGMLDPAQQTVTTIAASPEAMLATLRKYGSPEPGRE